MRAARTVPGRSRAAFDRHEPVMRARALVAYHAGHFHQLYRILATHRLLVLPRVFAAQRRLVDGYQSTSMVLPFLALNVTPALPHLNSL